MPVAPREVCEELRALADEVVCLHSGDALGSVGSAYEDFSQTADEEVCALLARAGVEAVAGASRRGSTERAVKPRGLEFRSKG